MLLTFVIVTTLVGCSTAPERGLSREPARFAYLPNGRDPLDPDRILAHEGPAESLVEGAIPAFEARRGHALNILQLSGGGQFGAFGAGFLKGWQETGERPEFDFVTGVSTGALLATHAFLGMPADDAVLEEIFTTISTANVYRFRGVLGLLFGANSLYDTSPLKGLLDKYITEEVLQRVAAAQDEGRRLIVGTTNLDYNQTWIWNMGLIAKQGDAPALELYKKILLASAAPPIAFPPVEIDGHLFADGGVRQNIVIIGLGGERRPGPPKYGPGNIYVVHNGKHRSSPKALRNDVVSIGGPVLDTMLNASMDSLLLRTYFAARARGYRFNLVAIPDDVDAGEDPLAFDPAQMQASFEAGYELGRRSDPWEKRPPIIGDMPGWAFGVLGSLPGTGERP